MNLERVFNWIGIGLLVACFLIALGRIVSRTRTALTPGVEEIRVAHWQLEPGFREAFDEVAAAYMARNPNTIVRQIPVPERTYLTWVRTQLVGGTAPDIILIGLGMTDEIIGRYFRPLTEDISHPNPYNEGTVHAGLPWRETFVDGLTGGSYNVNLLENYGISTSMFTIRIFYNKALWKEALGDRPPPRTYEELIAVCEDFTAYARQTGLAMVPFAGSTYTGQILIERLFSSQVQRLSIESSPLANFVYTGPDVALDFLHGRRTVRDREIQAGWSLMRAIGRHIQPGFLQLAREDATLYFVQQRALMTTTGSWDAASLRVQAPFEIGAFPIPLPTRDHPEFGRQVVGPVTEIETSLTAGFGVNRGSPNQDRALDFLRYFSSFEGNRKFTARSGWLPVVVGVEPGPEQRPFAPVLDGYPGGFNLILTGGAEVNRLMRSNFFRLFNAGGSLESFTAVVEQGLAAALRRDLLIQASNSRNILVRQDIQTFSLHLLAQRRGDPDAAAKLAEVLEGQTGSEINLSRLSRELSANVR